MTDMRDVARENYYELLEVAPTAPFAEIERAYRRVLAMYGEDSLASYALFSETERKNLLAGMERAYNTLINPESRLRYDSVLVKHGILSRDECFSPVPENGYSPAGSSDDSHRADEVHGHVKPSQSILSHAAVKDLMEKDTLSGADLRRIRMEAGFSLNDIAAETKIRIPLLEAIENDEIDRLPSRFHVKSFLKAYVRCLVVDAETIVHRYLKRFP